VLATKFTFQTDPKAGILVTGNSRRAMVSSVEASLKRLKTDRIDLYWAHVSDAVTPAEEIVRVFDDLVRAGKILYAGLSDFPAWRVARAATFAELRGVTPIAGLQVEHSLVERTTEQELLPAGQALGLGIVAWSPLGGGMLTGKYRQGEKGRREGFGGRVFQEENSAHRTAILDTLIAVAKDAGVTPAEIAIAWVAAKGSLPIIGPRTLAELENNLAIKVTLSPQQIARLDEVSAIPAVFPHRMLNNPERRAKASQAASSSNLTRRRSRSPQELEWANDQTSRQPGFVGSVRWYVIGPMPEIAMIAGSAALFLTPS
jgi:aryl-alcohol dehydrogenase-like predicted oxidoreductase